MQCFDVTRLQVTLAAVYLLLHLTITNSMADCPYEACSCSGVYINCHNQGFDAIPPLTIQGLNTYPILRFEDTNWPFSNTSCKGCDIKQNVHAVYNVQDGRLTVSFHCGGTTRGYSTVVVNAWETSETYRRMKAQYGVSCLSQRRVYEWVDIFQNGGPNLMDEPRRGRSASLATDTLKQQIDQRVRNNRKYIYVAINQISSIPDNSIPSGLTEIDFGNNPILDISPGAFTNSAKTLETLSFTNAQLGEIPGAFLSLRKLRSLTIKNTPLLNWNLEVLQHIGSSIQELILNNVGLTSWPTWMQYFPYLTTLSLTNSQISPIPDLAFNLIKDNLQSLTLVWASLLTVPKVITTLTNLTWLDLSNNEITEPENLPQLSSLQTLSLGNNHISDVYKLVYELSPHSSTLTYLYLHDNLLTTIPRLAHMSTLEIINLNNNQITDASSGSLPSLLFSLQIENNQLSSTPDAIKGLTHIANLLISGNSIQEISPNDIPVQLSHLDIRNNAISMIKDATFPTNSSLRTLLLSDNPIINITASAFINISELQTLELQNTSLARVPIALSGLTNLQTLNLKSNPLLVCTCQESGLSSWFRSRPEMLTQGRCGDISVGEFFTDLASQCPKR